MSCQEAKATWTPEDLVRGKAQGPGHGQAHDSPRREGMANDLMPLQPQTQCWPPCKVGTRGQVPPPPPGSLPQHRTLHGPSCQPPPAFAPQKAPNMALCQAPSTAPQQANAPLS